jgi:extensin-like protein
MTRGVRLYIVGSVALLALAGCGGGWLMEQREPWRHEAEVACLKSGSVKLTSSVTQVAAINGPGMCGADFPLKVAALGESPLMGFADDPRPPGAIPRYQPMTTRPVASPGYPPQPYPQPAYPAPYGRPANASPTYADQPVQPGAPLSLKPPGAPDADEPEEAYPPAPAAPYGTRPAPYGSRGAQPPAYPSPGPYSTREGPYDPAGAQPPEPYFTPPPRTYGGHAPYGSPPPQPAEPLPRLGPSSPPVAATPAAITPVATLACPMVSSLDQWVSGSVQPAAMRWFGQPVIEIRQISAYSCRGMNGNPRARISEHAFGNALDIAAFTLADGRKVTVKDGWRGHPEERGFLRDVHAAACQQFSTVLGPGSNIYHYDHLHVDLMRRSSGRGICNPAAVPGDLVAGRMGYPGRGADVTGSVRTRPSQSLTPEATADLKRMGFGKKLPVAVAGED